MRRSSVAPILVASLLVFALAPAGADRGASFGILAAVADDDHDDKDDGARPAGRAKDAGSVEGEVVSVDYRASRFVVKSGPATYDIVVLPSTDFEGHSNAFRGMADIKKGAHVNVMLSRRAAVYTAQIIHLH